MYEKTRLLPEGRGIVYSPPVVGITDVRIEKGFAGSDPADYGQEGGAGDELGPGNDYEF